MLSELLRGKLLLVLTAFGMIANPILAAEPRSKAMDESELFVPIPQTSTIRFEPKQSEGSVPRQFQQTAHTFRYRAEFVRNSGPVRVFDITFPSPVTSDHPANNIVYGSYFQPQGAGPFPGVVILHVLGGEFALSQMIANWLARKGIATLFIKMPYYGERRGKESRRRMISPDAEQTVAAMTQAVLDIRRAATWLENRPEVARDQLGVTGISLGGIMSALSGAVEPRFQKIAIYLGGADLAESLWEHRHPIAQYFRRQWIAEGGTRQSLAQALKPIDPATYGHLLQNRDVLIVAAKHDQIISPKSTRALWQSIGRQGELIWLDAGHINAIKYLFSELQRLERFFSDAPVEAGENVIDEAKRPLAPRISPAANLPK